MRAYLRAEGTVIVIGDDDSRLIEFEPVIEAGHVTGTLPVMLGGRVLEAVRECYRFMGWPEISTLSCILQR